MDKITIKINDKEYKVTKELAEKFIEQAEKLNSTCEPGSIWCVNGLENKCKSDGSGWVYTGGEC